jgi:hypothetical protein
MTGRWHCFFGLTPRLRAGARSFAHCLRCIALATFIPVAIAHADEQARVPAGFAAAQTCESEIDEDLGRYEECIHHAASGLAKKPHALLGLHFQAWLVADLAARQHSPRSAAARRAHLQQLQALSRSTGITVDQLCALKNLRCSDIKNRMQQKI